MINILLEGYNIDAPFLYDELKKHLKAEYRVAVVALSFRDNAVGSPRDWDAFYGKEQGIYYRPIVSGLRSYGIAEESITFINYFKDTKETAAEKIKNADVVYFLGGLPDRMMDRIRELDLEGVLLEHSCVVMGYSAGALIQLGEYHLSPDKDYPEFVYRKGIPYLDRFYLEVHYENTATQDEAISRVISERGKTVYATCLHSGGILVDNGEIKLLGRVEKFN